jgi:hypothetical protein
MGITISHTIPHWAPFCPFRGVRHRTSRLASLTIPLAGTSRTARLSFLFDLRMASPSRRSEVVCTFELQSTKKSAIARLVNNCTWRKYRGYFCLVGGLGSCPGQRGVSVPVLSEDVSAARPAPPQPTASTILAYSPSPYHSSIPARMAPRTAVRPPMTAA